MDLQWGHLQPSAVEHIHQLALFNRLLVVAQLFL
jgi:hypothetical protein